MRRGKSLIDSAVRLNLTRWARLGDWRGGQQPGLEPPCERNGAEAGTEWRRDLSANGRCDTGSRDRGVAA